MASIARCLRATRPLSLSTLSKPAFTVSRTSFLLSRQFSVSPSSLIRKYTKDHEWIDVSADGTTGVVGISEYAAEQLGDVVYVELPEEGNTYAQGDVFGAVESVKSASDINTPIACTVTEVNALLEEKPGTINQVPEDDAVGGGWIARVEITDPEKAQKELDSLMDLEAYKTFTASEDH